MAVRETLPSLLYCKPGRLPHGPDPDNVIVPYYPRVAGTRKFRQSGGEEVEAEVVGFRATGEHWNEYLLDDGTVFKIKLVVTEIARVKDRYDAKGDPIYAATHTQVTAVDAPENMRRPPES
jgi:hypothetical protein